MKAFYVAMILMLTAGAAYAQVPGSINLFNDEKARTPEEREKDKVINDAYKSELKKIPDQKASSDPWGGVRSSESPKTTPGKSAPAAHKQNPK